MSNHEQVLLLYEEERRRLEKLRDRLYSQKRMDAEEMRDWANSLDSLLKGALSMSEQELFGRNMNPKPTNANQLRTRLLR